MNLTETEQKIMRLCKTKVLSRKEILQKLGDKTKSGNLKKAFPQLLQLGILAYTIPDKPHSSILNHFIS